MPTWEIAVILLVLVWALQSVGVWMQMRHYREALGDIEQKFARGFVGTGFTRGRLAKGTIALVVVSETLEVERVAVMAGRSVFAKFKARREFDRLMLDELRTQADTLAGTRAGRSLGQALQQAIAQIDAVRAKKQQSEQQGGDTGVIVPEQSSPGLVPGRLAAATG